MIVSHNTERESYNQQQGKFQPCNESFRKDFQKLKSKKCQHFQSEDSWLRIRHRCYHHHRLVWTQQVSWIRIWTDLLSAQTEIETDLEILDSNSTLSFFFSHFLCFL